MGHRVSLCHITEYDYDKKISLGPQIIRLRPAPHCKVNVESYQLEIFPEHFLNWQQDPFNNYLAYVKFPEKTDKLRIQTNLIVNMSVLNPFDFFLEEYVSTYPFTYENELSAQLSPYLYISDKSNVLLDFIKKIKIDKVKTLDYLNEVNKIIYNSISYVIRLEPGVQDCAFTLEKRTGSCRDMSWLLCQILRHMGFATRFTSGYLMQLKSEIQNVSGPNGPKEDFADLHAWTEVYLPGSGWIGFDPTSGLMTGEGHLPLCSTPEPQSASPISGKIEKCESTLNFSLNITRLNEHKSTESPYSDKAWDKINELGKKVDEQIVSEDIRLTMGGEPTFVSSTDVESEEWKTRALGKNKKELATKLLWELKKKFANNGIVTLSQGKWYAGEELPRWSLNCYWRDDNEKLWEDISLLSKGTCSVEKGKKFLESLAKTLNVSKKCIISAYDDDNFSGYVLPLIFSEKRKKWCTNFWSDSNKINLLPGDGSIGYRIKLNEIPSSSNMENLNFSNTDEFPSRLELLKECKKRYKDTPLEDELTKEPGTVKFALTVRIFEEQLHVFLPPVGKIEHYLDLITSIEYAALLSDCKLIIEGYAPPEDDRLKRFSITPDPGVIEVNIHPANSWDEIVYVSKTLYENARKIGLSTEKFMQDGLHIGTGGGNHMVLGGASLDDSPFLRRPDLLRSLVTYWQRHPSLSYLFSGQFIGPTSQAPRIDEARHDSLYELEIAFAQIKSFQQEPYWLVDRLLRNLLVDITGNTHRTEFCIDKLYSPDSEFGRKGLLELRAFEMSPHYKMNLVQVLLLRALIVMFWKKPIHKSLVRFGTKLHDKYMLPYFVWNDFKEVLSDLNDGGFDFELDWFESFFEFRFAKYGEVNVNNIKLEVRKALEIWNVLGEQNVFGATSRGVDSATDRIQIKVNGLDKDRYAVICNNRILPLHSTGIHDEYIAGVRYKAWAPPFTLHPNLPKNSSLVFNVVDLYNEKIIGGCTYHVSHPGGRSYDDNPVNSNVAESRRMSRFTPFGTSPNFSDILPLYISPEFPYTLDLRMPIVEELIDNDKSRFNKKIAQGTNKFSYLVPVKVKKHI